MSDEETAARAEAVKNEGNELFKESHFADALEKYNQAIDLNPEVPTYYCNRAFCHTKMENHGLAIEDAGVALELDRSCAKGYYRRAASYMALGKYKKALTDYKSLKQLKPNDKDVLAKFKACEKEVKREAFERAIHTEEGPTQSVADQLDVNAIEVESSYDGPTPTIPGLTHDDAIRIAQHLKEQKTLHKKFAYQIVIEAKRILNDLPTLVDVPVPEGSHINVCGDTHGQYYDLLNIFDSFGYPSETNPYLFNGDFVDRGSFSLEVVLLLLTFKVVYPEHLHLSRGNHETLSMNKIYGFEGEVKHKYDQRMFQLYSETFHCLPLCHVLGGKVIVMHGGLFSRDDVTLDEVRRIERKREPPDEGLMSELLWSDPQPMPGRLPSKRGVGLSFGPDVTADFLQRNGLKLLVRSHEVKDAGYEVEANGKLITVFSAPNYCDQMGNKGALLCFDSNLDYEAKQFEAVPHPPVRAMAYAGGMGMFGF